MGFFRKPYTRGEKRRGAFKKKGKVPKKILRGAPLKKRRFL